MNSALPLLLLQFAYRVRSQELDFTVTFNAPAGNITICDQPTYVFGDATIPLTSGTTIQTGGWFTQLEPTVSWTATEGKLYSLLMMDPDATYCGAGTYLHWMNLNIAGSDLDSGNVINAYAHPAPPEMRWHRYAILLIEQDDEIVVDDDEIAELQGRSSFDYLAFMSAHDVAPSSELTIDVQLDAFIVQYYDEGAYCSFPESCSLVS
uniref:Phosphatidylethanolamine-binding protein n=1 Tax=Octactis speculum TaxID=3111310 RepID=A0A7S2CP07_9STRA|mmetsp:Transcript_38233/g.51758  ORF Transcript_38233/g.51758 Transcript_38233/m.51758 type:complete len:207 (+) Transcript_38233:22-642(+)